jgi:hypothetical protein
MALSLNTAHTAIIKVLNAGLTPILLGQPGIGKSDLMRRIAKEFNYKLIDMRLAQCEPTDLLGFPSVQGDKARYTPMETFPLETDAIPEGYKGWLLFLDELPNANVHVQLAAYKLILDREVGNHKLHDKCAIVSAGNREQDGCFVQEMPSALKSRMVHLDLEMNVNEWLDYAIKSGMDYRVTSFIGFNKAKLHSEYLDSEESSYACPRTWDFVSRIIKPEADLTNAVMRNILNGTISSAVTSEFLAYVKYFDKLPTYAQVVKEPVKTKIADQYDLGLIWATIAMLTTNCKMEDIKNVMTYVERLPDEYQLIFVKYLATKYPNEILDHPDMEDWIAKIVDMTWS